jgi:hypothetical protein
MRQAGKICMNMTVMMWRKRLVVTCPDGYQMQSFNGTFYEIEFCFKYYSNGSIKNKKHLVGEIFGGRDHCADGCVADGAGGAVVDGHGNGVASIVNV